MVLCAATKVAANPTAFEDYAYTQFSSPVTVDVLGNDYAGGDQIDPTTVELVRFPGDGEIWVDPVSGEIAYSPDFGFEGEDTFAYRVLDASGQVSNTATVYVWVDANQPPILEFVNATYDAYNLEWTIEGKVTDEAYDWLDVEMSGAANYSLEVDENGGFWTTLNADPDMSLYVIITVTDNDGASTQPYELWMYPY